MQDNVENVDILDIRERKNTVVDKNANIEFKECNSNKNDFQDSIIDNLKVSLTNLPSLTTRPTFDSSSSSSSSSSTSSTSSSSAEPSTNSLKSNNLELSRQPSSLPLPSTYPFPSTSTSTMATHTSSSMNKIYPSHQPFPMHTRLTASQTAHCKNSTNNHHISNPKKNANSYTSSTSPSSSSSSSMFRGRAPSSPITSKSGKTYSDSTKDFIFNRHRDCPIHYKF